MKHKRIGIISVLVLILGMLAFLIYPRLLLVKAIINFTELESVHIEGTFKLSNEQYEIDLKGNANFSNSILFVTYPTSFPKIVTLYNNLYFINIIARIIVTPTIAIVSSLVISFVQFLTFLFKIYIHAPLYIHLLVLLLKFHYIWLTLYHIFYAIANFLLIYFT